MGCGFEDALDDGIVVHVVDMPGLTPSEWAKVRSVLSETMQMKSVPNAFLIKQSKRG